MNTELFNKGLIAAGLGLSGVFLVLILFYFLTKLLLYIFRKFPEQ
ncbi:MAG TPA: OadG family protein [Bacillota bacterium]|nr:OadG family protein [Bacillota bacterium]